MDGNDVVQFLGSLFYKTIDTQTKTTTVTRNTEKQKEKNHNTKRHETKKN